MPLLATDLELARNAYYAATAGPAQAYPGLTADTACDVAVVSDCDWQGSSASSDMGHTRFASARPGCASKPRARLRPPARRPFPGGAWLRTPALVLAMAWYRLRDMLGQATT